MAAWPLPEIRMGQEEPGIELEVQFLPLRDKRLPWVNSLPLPCESFCLPVWVFLSKGGKPNARMPLPWPLPFLLLGGLGSWPLPVPLPFDLPLLFALLTLWSCPLLAEPLMSESPWPKPIPWPGVGELLPRGPTHLFQKIRHIRTGGSETLKGASVLELAVPKNLTPTGTDDY